MANWENLDAAFAELEAECTDIVRGMTVEIFLHTLQYSPQAYGRFVSSWTYEIGRPKYWTNPQFDIDMEDSGQVALSRKGDPEAIFSAMLHNSGKDSGFRLGDTVYISNGVDHGQGSYAGLIEEGQINLRAVNMPGRPLGRAIDRAATWFANDVNPKHAANLKALRIY